MRKATKRPLFLAVSVAALLSLGGCVYPDGYYDDGYYQGGYYGDDYYYDGYYDGYYGPYAGGYWATDGFFYYWLQDRYYRDDRRHFRRDHFPGAFRFRGDRDGPSRWRQHGYKPYQDYQQQWPAPAHPPRHRPRQGGQQPDHD
jgi:hypothetical protein